MSSRKAAVSPHIRDQIKLSGGHTPTALLSHTASAKNEITCSHCDLLLKDYLTFIRGNCHHLSCPAISLFFFKVPSFSPLLLSGGSAHVCAADKLKRDEILISSLHPGWVHWHCWGEGEWAVFTHCKGLVTLTLLTERHNIKVMYDFTFHTHTRKHMY